MKREILFRGKRVDNGEWVEGDLVINKPTKTYRIFSDFANVVHGEFNESGLHECSGYLNIVMPETVGQFTGLTDKNGKRIFEGDLVSFEDDPIDEVIYDKTYSGFVFNPIEKSSDVDFYEDWLCLRDVHQKYYVNRGNIHDNPELL